MVFRNQNLGCTCAHYCWGRLFSWVELGNTFILKNRVFITVLFVLDLDNQQYSLNYRFKSDLSVLYLPYLSSPLPWKVVSPFPETMWISVIGLIFQNSLNQSLEWPPCYKWSNAHFDTSFCRSFLCARLGDKRAESLGMLGAEDCSVKSHQENMYVDSVIPRDFVGLVTLFQ